MYSREYFSTFKVKLTDLCAFPTITPIPLLLLILLTLKTPVHGHIINSFVKFDSHWFEIALFITLKPNNALITPDEFNDVFQGNYVVQEQCLMPKYPQLPRCVHREC